MPEQKDAPSPAVAKKAIEEQIDTLKKVEAQTVPGAPSRALKSSILDARALEEKHPDKYFRYVNIANPSKVESRKAKGFKRVSRQEAEAAGVVAEQGNLVLMEAPREVHERHVEEVKQRNRELLDAHKNEVERAAEAVVRELRDKHGIRVPLDRMLLQEG